VAGDQQPGTMNAPVLVFAIPTRITGPIQPSQTADGISATRLPKLTSTYVRATRYNVICGNDLQFCDATQEKRRS
jgi:hypothetical protein